jgi:Tol biopolymer transport system component
MKMNLITIIIMMVCFAGCKENVTGPHLVGGKTFCYVAFSNGHWNIFTNDISGGNPKNISNYMRDDGYPQWSPDGGYIVYSRSNIANEGLIIVYDTKSETEINLTPDGPGASQMPQWLPNGKLCFGYPFFWAPYKGTYIMDPDGKNKKMILDSVLTAAVKLIYFYPDNYRFLYVLNWTQVYRSNIDRTVNEYLVDLTQAVSPKVGIQGFNPLTENLLVTSSSASGLSTISTYCLATKSTSIILTAEQGFQFFQVKYSNDYSKIAMVEHSDNDEYLSVLENGIKKRLVHIPKHSPAICFSYQPMEFSPDGQYIAYSKQVFNNSQLYSWTEYLQVVNITTGEVNDIGQGLYPSWNPKQ